MTPTSTKTRQDNRLARRALPMPQEQLHGPHASAMLAINPTAQRLCRHALNAQQESTASRTPRRALIALPANTRQRGQASAFRVTPTSTKTRQDNRLARRALPTRLSLGPDNPIACRTRAITPPTTMASGRSQLVPPEHIPFPPRSRAPTHRPANACRLMVPRVSPLVHSRTGLVTIRMTRAAIGRSLPRTQLA